MKASANPCRRCIKPFRMKRALLTLDYLKAAEGLGGWNEAAGIRTESEKDFGRKTAGWPAGNDLKGLAAYFRSWPESAISLTAGMMAVRIKACPFFEGLISLGLTKDEIKDLSSLLCLEEYFVQGFNPSFDFSIINCLMRGDPDCRFEIKGHEASAAEKLEFDESCPARAEGRTCPADTFGALTARYTVDLKKLSEVGEVSDRQQQAIRIRYLSAKAGGELLAKKADRTDLEGLVKYYWSKFPNVSCRLEEGTLICEALTCALATGLEELSVIGTTGLSHMACICDEAAIAGFNSEIFFQQSRNLLDGDKACRWELRLKTSR
ncbi:MAG: hypothetical protein HQK55_03575 [Deltaproteobacteria bacterium]|nr:hypothetical protein [Deltaproteobacteria bacterium]